MKCGHQFEVANLNQPHKKPTKIESSVPKGIKKFKDGDKIVILRSWERGVGVLNLCLSSPFLIFIVLFMSYSLGELWVLLFVTVVFFLPYCAIAYDALQNIFNVSRIEIDTDRIVLIHKPIAFRGKIFNTKDVLQVCVSYDIANRARVYHVMLMLETGKHEKLLEALPYEDQAKYIFQQIENYAGIEQATCT